MDSPRRDEKKKSLQDILEPEDFRQIADIRRAIWTGGFKGFVVGSVAGAASYALCRQHPKYLVRSGLKFTAKSTHRLPFVLFGAAIGAHIGALAYGSKYRISDVLRNAQEPTKYQRIVREAQEKGIDRMMRRSSTRYIPQHYANSKFKHENNDTSEPIKSNYDTFISPTIVPSPHYSQSRKDNPSEYGKDIPLRLMDIDNHQKTYDDESLLFEQEQWNWLLNKRINNEKKKNIENNKYYLDPWVDSEQWEKQQVHHKVQDRYEQEKYNNR